MLYIYIYIYIIYIYIYGVITYLRTCKAALMRRKRRNMHVCRWYIYVSVLVNEMPKECSITYR